MPQRDIIASGKVKEKATIPFFILALLVFLIIAAVVAFVSIFGAIGAAESDGARWQ